MATRGRQVTRPALPLIARPVVCGPRIWARIRGQTCDASSVVAVAADSAGPKAIRELALRPEIVAKSVPDSRVARIARSTSLCVLLGALGIVAARSSAVQDNLRALPAEADKDCIGITRQQADAILKELRRIRQILEKQGRSGLAEQMPVLPQIRRLSLKGGVSLGSGQAPNRDRGIHGL